MFTVLRFIEGLVFPCRFWWLAMVFVLAVIAKLPIEGVLSVSVTLAIFVIAVVAAMSPWLGLLAIFPLSFGINPAPETIGPREMAFATLCIALMLGTLAQAIREGVLHAEMRKWGLPVVAATVFVALNFLVARANDVPLYDWTRGLVPFVFLIVFWPVSLLLRNGEDKLKWLGVSLLLMAFLYVSQVLVVYFAEGLYNPVYYILVDGRYVLSDPPIDLANPGAVLGPFYLRVTTILAQSTDALLPVTFAVAYVVSILSPSRQIRRIALLVTCFASSAILTTQTRSMLLCALISVSIFGLGILFFKTSLFLNALAKGVIIIAVSVGSIFVMNLEAVWYNRVLLLYHSLNLEAVFGPDFMAAYPAWSSESSAFANDVNISTRLEEYRIALDVFRSQPITGAGFGNRHEIVFETFEGEKLVQKVGYVHNWVFYFLMVGGIIGALLYSMLLVLPSMFFGLRLWRHRRNFSPDYIAYYALVFNIVWVTFLTMGLYALFFAVFRLISFNLVMAAGLGICAHVMSVALGRKS